MIKVINENTISFKNKFLKLNGVEIDQYLEIDNLLIINLIYTDKNSYWYTEGRGVIAFDQSGKEVWRIEEAPEKRGAHNCYVNIRLNDKNELIASGEGRIFRVNTENGKITLLRDVGSKW